MPTLVIRSLLTLVAAGLTAPALCLGADEADTVTWSDTSRDVYVDGELELGAVVLTAKASEEAGRRLAVLSELTDRAFVVDLESLEVDALPLSHFELTAEGGTSTPAEALATGRATRVKDRRSTHYLALVGEHTVLISPHQGPVGEIQLEDLFESAPTWRRRAEGYEPDAEAVAALAAYREEVDVTVAFGTWCGDSRNYVPKVLRSLEKAANPKLRLELVAIGRSFGEPAEHILGQRLTNVPTVIVHRGGEEIGRIVETPAADTVEGDLAAILGKAQEPHQGRWSREAEIARGRYVYRDSEERPVGKETWEIFSTEGGGRLLHSTVVRDGRELEIWHRRDSAGASEFVELTRSHGGEHSRTRIWIDGSELRAVTRGNLTGIVEQTLEVPPGTSFSLPCAAEAGYDWLRGERPDGASTLTAFQLAAEQPAAGKLVEVSTSSRGEETVSAAHGKIAALGLEAETGGVASRWWLDSDLGVPVRGSIEGMGKITLEELVVAR